MILLDKELIQSFSGKTVVIKYGGNAMLNENLKKSVIEDICHLADMHIKPIIVHGGGPFINKLLEMAKVQSEFVDGHRKTTVEAMMYIEMALKGQVNGELVRLIHGAGKKAVGLSGKDGKMVSAVKRMHKKIVDGKEIIVDLHQVGDVDKIDTSILQWLIENTYIPVIATIAWGPDNLDYNVNADMFAGHLAAALHAEAYIVMTDVNGLMRDVNDPSSLIHEISAADAANFTSLNIKGGMLPKMDSCIIALNKGVKTIRIINGTVKHAILTELFTHERSGTIITK